MTATHICILTAFSLVPPKGKNSEVLLYPPEEKFNLSSFLVEHCDILSLDRKVIGKECERPLVSGQKRA